MAKRRNKARILAAVLVLAMVLGMIGSSFASHAATATVGGTGVRIRASASTSSEVIGSANTGDTFEVGDPVTASDGAKWYRVTLSNGQSGYIRSDLLSVQEDPAPAQQPVQTPVQQPTEQPTQSTEPAEPAAPAQTVENEKYQLVNVPTDSGADQWYVYDYEDGLRIKVEDLSQYDTIRANAEKYQKSAGRYKTMMIIFAILAVLALAALVYLFLRYRDEISGDVTIDRNRRNVRPGQQSRVRQGANGSARADRSGKPYPSGQPAGRGAQPGRRPAPGEAQRPARPQQGGQPAPGQVRRPVRPQQGTETAARPQAQQAGAPAQAPVRRPQPSQESAAEQAQVRKPAPARNFAVDEDLDYGFLKNKE